MAYIKISEIVLGVLTKNPRLPMQNFSEEAGVVEEMAGVISTKDSREAKMLVLAMVSKTSLEVPMVIRVKSIGLLSVSIVKSRN